MRVTRRVCPSQIGCGLSIARRRLVHAQTHNVQLRQTSPDYGSRTVQLTMVEIDFGDALDAPGDLELRARVERPGDHASSIGATRARGW